MKIECLPVSAAADRPKGERVGPLVGHLLPAGYDAYLRLFHPFLSWEATRGGPRKPTTQWTTWRALAEQARVPFGAGLTSRQLERVLPIRGKGRRYGVADGELEPETAAALIATLSESTKEKMVYFYFGLAAVIRAEVPMVFRGPLSSFEQVRGLADEAAGQHVPGPETMWPEDRSWVVVSDYDLVSTYIACDRPTAGLLLGRSDLEVLRIERPTKIG